MNKIVMLLIAAGIVCVAGTAEAKKAKKKAPQPSPKTYAEVVTILDTDADGKISKAEFIAAAPSEKIKAAKEANFTKLDTDGDEFLSEAEFNAAPKASAKKGGKKGGKKGKGKKQK